MNVFVQKGYKITGRAKVLRPDDVGCDDSHRKLTMAIGTAFPIISIIEIDPVKVDEIIAPRYRLFPDSGSEDRIKEALATCRVDQYKRQAEPADAGIVVSRHT